jgi:hypothetical protein
VTFAPSSYSEVSEPSGGNSPHARRFTEPLRELSVFALLAGNAVFLLIGVTRLFIVIDGWASRFGQRCDEVFPTFVGAFAVGVPIVAVLLATHVEPIVPRTRLVLVTALSEYAASGFFGVLTFLGAFAYDLRSPREVIEGVLTRGVWLAFLVLGGLVLYRIWRGLFPPPPPRRPVYGGYAPTTYGKPYPGQPMYPQPVTPPAGPSPTGQTSPGPTPTGWPEVPPPPMPAPVTVEPDPTTRLTPLPAESDPTMSLTPLSGEPPADATTQLPEQPQPPETETGGDATQVVPAPEERSEPSTQPIVGREEGQRGSPA